MAFMTQSRLSLQSFSIRGQFPRLLWGPYCQCLQFFNQVADSPYVFICVRVPVSVVNIKYIEDVVES